MYFRRDETFIHSIVFTGNTVITIGVTDEMTIGFDVGAHRGRVETINFDDGEELLACEIHHSKECTFGITWVKWQRYSD